MADDFRFPNLYPCVCGRVVLPASQRGRLCEDCRRDRAEQQDAAPV
jgi:hypothetical protein